MSRVVAEGGRNVAPGSDGFRIELFNDVKFGAVSSMTGFSVASGSVAEGCGWFQDDGAGFHRIRVLISVFISLVQIRSGIVVFLQSWARLGPVHLSCFRWYPVGLHLEAHVCLQFGWRRVVSESRNVFSKSRGLLQVQERLLQVQVFSRSRCLLQVQGSSPGPDVFSKSRFQRSSPSPGVFSRSRCPEVFFSNSPVQ